jgi:hypothetical protein
MIERRVGRLEAVDASASTPAVGRVSVTEVGRRGGTCMVEHLPERLPRWARLVALVAVWVAIYISLVHRVWAVVCLVGIGAVLWLFWLERATTPRRTVLQAVLRIAFWAIASLFALVALFFVALAVATVGAEIGLWGSPWDDR